jgi:hypothetical protein
MVLALTQLRTPVGVSGAGTLLPLAPVLPLFALPAVSLLRGESTAGSG